LNTIFLHIICLKSSVEFELILFGFVEIRLRNVKDAINLDFDESIQKNYLEEEVEAENSDEHRHCEGRDEQQQFAAEFVHDEGGRNGRRNLHHANNDAVVPGLELGARLHENIIGKEEHGVDSGQLLQEHGAD